MSDSPNSEVDRIASRLRIPARPTSSRHRGQLFNFLGAETVGQRDDFHARLNRVRIGLDIELVK